MTTLEIILLIAGLVFIIVSYLISERFSGKKESSMIKEEDIKILVTKEIETMKSKMVNNLEETADTTLRSTYRDLEKVSNEKIMAVSEYSDSVLGEIQKNHKEVIFLYNMLSDKEEKLKGTVVEADKAKTEVKSLIDEAEKKMIDPKPEVKLENTNQQQTKVVNHTTEESEKKESLNIEKANSNNQIIELFEQGISKTDIARQLGLGLGEVRLVLDLFKGEEK